MKPIIVIPTYNERDNIGSIIQAVLFHAPEANILVVDDGSPDGTGQIIRDMMDQDERIHLIERAGKMGLGTAYCRGFEYALEKGFDVVFEMDADFSHDPKELPRFLKEIEDHDLIIGSRYISGVNVVNWPMSRLLLSYFASIYTRVITGMPIKDATGGFKAFRADVLKKINLKKIRSNGYAFQIEMNFKAWKAGARIKEIPIIFIDRRSGVSKMSRKIVYEAVFLVWKLRIASIFGRV
ncbi:MAG TPA: polyprenol monophosphomannose synthase [Patescibacteria group bacterium]|nr:polyprenol monophosphomannose synthase [Patescibacteria group bacterium]